MEEETVVLISTKEAIAKELYRIVQHVCLTFRGASAQKTKQIIAEFEHDYDGSDESFRATALEFAKLFIEKISK